MNILNAGNSQTLTLNAYDTLSIATRNSVRMETLDGTGAVTATSTVNGVKSFVQVAASKVRITAINGNCHFGVQEPKGDLHLATDSLGNATGILDPRTGLPISLGQSATITGTPSIGSTLTATLPTGVTGTLQFTRTLLASPFTKSNISGAVANAVNSLAYTVQSADTGCSVGCDASSTVVASTGVSIVAVATVRNNGVMRLFGNQSQIAIPSPQTAATNGFVMKIQAPSGAIGARVSVHNRATALGAAYIKAQMAPTDVAAIDTAANAFNAQVAGVVNNSAYNAGTNPNGFVKAKWKGATQSRRIYPSDAVPPSLGYANQEDTVTSDLIALPATPIPAKDRTGPEYYYILRLTVGAVANQDGLAGVYAAKLNAYAAEWTATNGADCSLLFANGTGTADSGDTSFSIPGSATQGQSPSVSIEWTYPPTVQPTTFLHVGDSITEDYQWNRWAVQRKSTAARPLHVVNCGGSTTRTKDYLGNMYLLLQTMARPDYVVMPIISVNNYSPLSDFANTFSNAQVEYTRLQEVAAYLTGLGIKIIWWVPFNFGANPASNDTASSWGYLYNNAKAYAAANSITWMDINGDSRMVRSVYNASTNATGWIDPDNTHPSTPAGKIGFAAVYNDTLTALGF